jgi:carbamoyl-phosphate synthase large subunit
MNILVTSLGSNPSIGVVKALKYSGIEGLRIIGTDSNEKHLCAGAAMVDVFYKMPLVSNPQFYEEALLEIIKKESINCVIPIHDLEVEYIASLSEKYPNLTFWAVNNLQIISLCNNKVKANKTAQEAGLLVPTYIEFDPNHSNIDNLRFPIIAKPLHGVSSRGLMVFDKEEDLKNALPVMERSADKYFLQNYLVDVEEYTVDCYSTYKGIFYSGIVRKRIETKSGIATKGVIVKNEDLIIKCENFLNKLKYKGASNIQFLCSKGEYYFVEINPRFSGAGVLSYKGGLNSPYLTIIEALGKELPLPSSLQIHYGLYMTRYWNEEFYDEKGNSI